MLRTSPTSKTRETTPLHRSRRQFHSARSSRLREEKATVRRNFPRPRNGPTLFSSPQCARWILRHPCVTPLDLPIQPPLSDARKPASACPCAACHLGFRVVTLCNGFNVFLSSENSFRIADKILPRAQNVEKKRKHTQQAVNQALNGGPKATARRTNADPMAHITRYASAQSPASSKILRLLTDFTPFNANFSTRSFHAWLLSRVATLALRASFGKNGFQTKMRSFARGSARRDEPPPLRDGIGQFRCVCPEAAASHRCASRLRSLNCH